VTTLQVTFTARYPLQAFDSIWLQFPDVPVPSDAEQQHDMTITKTDAGMNNWVYYATLPATSSLEAVTYVVRLYNNGGNEAQVRAEHQVLRALRQVRT
jgi:hypothetical protein